MEFVITELDNILNMELGLKKYVRNKQKFIIKEFLITELHCTTKSLE